MHGRKYRMAAALFASALSLGPAPACAQDMDVSLIDPANQLESRIDTPYGKAVLGAADGDVTLIVFADYACPACREAQPVLDQLIAQDPKLRVIYRLLINEEEGREAALTSLAVANIGADWNRFHHALDAGGQPSPESIDAALVSSGIDRAGLPQIAEADATNAAIFDEAANNSALLAQRDGKALPAWVIGDGFAVNGFGLETLQAAIAAARAAQ